MTNQPAPALAQASSGPLRCEIHKNETDNAVELTGLISTSTAMGGSFRFVMTKSGSGGSSNISQSNKFDLEAGKEVTVGRATIGLEHGARLVAEFSVRSNDGIECRVTATLEH